MGFYKGKMMKNCESSPVDVEQGGIFIELLPGCKGVRKVKVMSILTHSGYIRIVSRDDNPFELGFLCLTVAPHPNRPD